MVLSAGPISYNSINFLIITTVFSRTSLIYWICPVFIITSFLAGVKSGDQCLLNFDILSCFLGS